MSFFCFQLDIVIWWEFVESKANWSDGVARNGDKCLWAAEHGFTVETVAMPVLSARSLADVIEARRNHVGIGSLAVSAFDGLLRALGVAARGL